MKKVALSLLALALVGAGAFAQAAPALTIGGYLDVGTLTTIKADSGNQTIVKGDDSGKVGGSYEFRAKYAAEKSGFVLNVRIEDLTTGAGAVAGKDATGATTASLTGTKFNVQDAFSWFLVPNVDMVKVLAGRYDNTGTAWNQLDDKGDKQTAGTGVALQVAPSDGVAIGGGYAPSQNVSGNGAWSFGGSFTVPGTAQVVAAAKTGSTEKDNKIGLDNVAASFKLLLDGPLSAKGGFNLYNLSNDSTKNQWDILDVTVGYAITDAFSASLLTYVYVYGSDLKVKNGTTGDSANLSYKVNPSVTYVVDPITSVGLGGTYFQGNGRITAGDGFTGTDGALNKLTGFEINPNVTFTVDANQKVLVNYLYDTWSGDDKPVKDASYSTIKVDYRYMF